MANRTIQQKILKMKRRGRYAKFSGSNSKFHPERGEDGDVYVGEISLSKQVVNTGRGPNNERMQQYYQRVHSYDEALPETIGLTEPMKDMKKFELTKKYQDFIKGVPKNMRITLVNNVTGMLDLYFAGVQWFFVDVDYKKKIIRRSKIYSSKKYAMLMLELHKITWVETLPK